jgi:hypothetical protein
MKIHIKHKETGEIKEIEGKSYLSLSKNIRDKYTQVSDKEKSNIDLQKAKENKKAEINKQRDLARDKDISHTVNGKIYKFQRDIVDQLAFINSIVSMTDTAVDGWVTSDNSIVDLSKSDLISICNHIRLRDGNEVKQARKRKDAVNALTTISEVENYDINTVYE